jgi:hypothetical protein
MTTRLKFTCCLAAAWVIGVSSEAAWLHRSRVKTLAAQARLERARVEYRTLSSTRETYGANVVARLTLQLTQASAEVARLRSELTRRGPKAAAYQAARAPVDRAESYFDVAGFIGRMRDCARERSVKVKPQESFGFAEYSSQGPEPADRVRTFRERWIAEYVLECLLNAHPLELVSVQREKRQIENATTTAAQTPRLSSLEFDYFNWEPKPSLRRQGLVDTIALKIAFVGFTASLRSLLNQLAESDLPMLVRAVEVTAGSRSEKRAGRTAHEGGSPLVPVSASQFAVTVEFVDFTASAASES